MRLAGGEVFLELLELLVYALGTTALGGFGVVVENAALGTLAGGDTTLALWMGFMGVVALAGALKIGTEKLVPQARRLVA